jgi:hypothetical protein
VLLHVKIGRVCLLPNGKEPCMIRRYRCSNHQCAAPEPDFSTAPLTPSLCNLEPISNKIYTKYLNHVSLDVMTIALPIRPARRRYDRGAINKPRAEDAVGVLKHAVFQTDDNELGALEPCLEETPNILRMGEIEGGIDLV